MLWRDQTKEKIVFIKLKVNLGETLEAVGFSTLERAQD